MPHVLGMQPPGAVDCAGVLVALWLRQRAAGAARCGPTGMMLVAPSESQMPVPARATCITCFAKSQTGWSMCWCAAVMLHAAV